MAVKIISFCKKTPTFFLVIALASVWLTGRAFGIIKNNPLSRITPSAHAAQCWGDNTVIPPPPSEPPGVSCASCGCWVEGAPGSGDDGSGGGEGGSCGGIGGGSCGGCSGACIG